MTFERKTVQLEGDAPGLAAEFTCFRIAPPFAPPKCHLQGGLHAE